MGYYYEDYEDYEPTDEEMETYMGEKSTSAVKNGNVLHVDFDMNNMCQGIVNAVKEQLKTELYESILMEVKGDILKDIKQTIMTSTGEIIKDLIVDFMNNEKITIGGDCWGTKKAEEYTLMDYAKKCIGDAIRDNKFSVVTEIKEEKSWSGSRFRVVTKDYKFNEFINAQLGIGNEIQKYFSEQIGDIKNQVNKDMKNLFDKTTKDMLAESVLNILMANDTYKRIQNQVACIADRTVD